LAPKRIRRRDEAGNAGDEIVMVPVEEAMECCVKRDIHGELTAADFEGEYSPISEKHVYVPAEHYDSHR
jgi:hypothetical protein